MGSPQIAREASTLPLLREFLRTKPQTHVLPLPDPSFGLRSPEVVYFDAWTDAFKRRPTPPALDAHARRGRSRYRKIHSHTGACRPCFSRMEDPSRPYPLDITRFDVG